MLTLLRPLSVNCSATVMTALLQWPALLWVHSCCLHIATSLIGVYGGIPRDSPLANPSLWLRAALLWSCEHTLPYQTWPVCHNVHSNCIRVHFAIAACCCHPLCTYIMTLFCARYISCSRRRLYLPLSCIIQRTHTQLPQLCHFQRATYSFSLSPADADSESVAESGTRHFVGGADRDVVGQLRELKLDLSSYYQVSVIGQLESGETIIGSSTICSLSGTYTGVDSYACMRVYVSAL